MSDVRVDHIDNVDHYSYVVRGTDDHMTALNAVRTHLIQEMGYTTDEANNWHPYSERRGWFRWNPCNENSCYEGGGHRCHLGTAQESGRGNWQAIEFDHGYKS